MKKEYLKELIEACLQNNDNECDLVQVDDTVKYVSTKLYATEVYHEQFE